MCGRVRVGGGSAEMVQTYGEDGRRMTQLRGCTCEKIGEWREGGFTVSGSEHSEGREACIG